MTVMNKKGLLQFLPIVLSTPFLLAGGLVLAVVFGGASFLVWLLARNFFSIIGGAVIIISALAFYRGIKVPFLVWMVGVVLMILPRIFSGLAGLTFQMVVG